VLNFIPSFSCILSCILLGNLLVDTTIDAPDNNGEKEGECSPSVLEVDPVSHHVILLLELNLLICLFWCNSESGFLYTKNEIAHVESQTNSNKFVDFEEKTKCSLLELEG